MHFYRLIRMLKLSRVTNAAMMATDGVIDVNSMPPSILNSGGGEMKSIELGRQSEWRNDEEGSLSDRVKAFEQREIRHTIDKYSDTTEGKRSAAKELGISLSSLYATLKE